MWIIMAWQCIISPKVTVSFEKCCIPSAMDKISDDMLRMAVNRIGILECEDNKGTDCEEGESDTDW
jgi:hypothetical protein